MFDEKQKRLFNQGYGAYREIVSFCIENISILDKEDEPSARAALVVMCDMQLQRLLFDISDFPNTELTDAETTFVKSIIESSSFLKNFVPGYGKFYRHMTADNYKAISEQIKKDTADIHIAMAIAVKMDSAKRDEAATLVINNLRTVFNSYIALSESDEATQNSIAMRTITHHERFATSQGVSFLESVEHKKTSSASNGEKALAELIGLESVKEDVIAMLNILKVNEMRKKEGLKPLNISKHMVFTGNPGTGKTTVARIIAQIYKENGLVSQGQLVETDRSGLVDTIIGGTAQKVKNKVEQALGGVLFIDEAYSLAKSESSLDFGHEAIATLVKLMEDNKDDLVVIVAGYKNEMKHFIESNPGLNSRFKKQIEFPDYTPEQMQEIFMKMVEADGGVLADDAVAPLLEIWEASKSDPMFGNGRGVRNVYEQVLANQATRVVNKGKFAKRTLTTIRKVDIPLASTMFDKPKPKNKIGFTL